MPELGGWSSLPTPVWVVLVGAVVLSAALLWHARQRRRIAAVLAQLAGELGGRVESGSFLYYPKLSFPHDGTDFELFMLSGGGQSGRSGKALFCSFPLSAADVPRFRVESRTVDSQIRKLAGASTLETGNPEFDRRFWIQGVDADRVLPLVDLEVQRQLLALGVASGVEPGGGKCTLFVLCGVGDGTVPRHLIQVTITLYERLKNELDTRIR